MLPAKVLVPVTSKLDVPVVLVMAGLVPLMLKLPTVMARCKFKVALLMVKAAPVTPAADLLSLTFDNTSTGRQLHGTGTLSFGSIPVETAPANPSKNWPATLLKDIKVEGCVYEELTFTRTYGSEFETVRKALPYRS